MDLVHMDQHTHLYEKLIDLLPELLQRSNMLKKEKSGEKKVEQHHHKKDEKERVKTSEKEPEKEKGELESILTRFEI